MAKTPTRPRRRTPVDETPVQTPAESVAAPVSNIRKRLEIDRSALDDEVAVHHITVFDLNEKVADERAVLDRMELTLKRRTGQRREEIRSTLAEVNSKAPTEKLLDSHVDDDEELQTMRLQIIDQRKAVAVAQAAADAWRQRGYALRELCSLHMSDHYGSTDSVRSATARDDMAESRRARAARAKREED